MSPRKFMTSPPCTANGIMEAKASNGSCSAEKASDLEPFEVAGPQKYEEIGSMICPYLHNKGMMSKSWVGLLCIAKRNCKFAVDLFMF